MATASSVEYVAAEEIVQSHVELNTPCTKAEGNSPEITTTEVKRKPSDQEHEGVIPISHGPSTEQVRPTSQLQPPWEVQLKKDIIKYAQEKLM